MHSLCDQRRVTDKSVESHVAHGTHKNGGAGIVFRAAEIKVKGSGRGRPLHTKLRLDFVLVEIR
jgi:hypothetical protein